MLYLNVATLPRGARGCIRQTILLTTGAISAKQLDEFAACGYLYAILDACDQPLIVPKINELGETYAISLFRGTSKEGYSAFAPYLVRVNQVLLDWIREKLWETPWGIFVLTNRAGLLELLAHFRSLLFPLLSDQRYWLFRYYDPRVLETYLATCTVEQLRAFYGPVRAVAINSAEPGGCLIFTEG